MDLREQPSGRQGDFRQAITALLLACPEPSRVGSSIWGHEVRRIPDNSSAFSVCSSRGQIPADAVLSQLEEAAGNRPQAAHPEIIEYFHAVPGIRSQAAAVGYIDRQ